MQDFQAILVALVPSFCSQVIEVDASAARWADDFQQQQQQSHNHHQQHQGGGSSSWAEEFQGKAAAAAAQAQGISHPAADWADQFAQGVADLNLEGEDVAGLQAAWNQVGFGSEFHLGCRKSQGCCVTDIIGLTCDQNLNPMYASLFFVKQ